MAIKVIINNKEVNNPIVRFLITLAGLVALIVIFIFVFFLVLPLIWLVVVSILCLVLMLLVAKPKLVSIYRINLLEKRTREHKK